MAYVYAVGILRTICTMQCVYEISSDPRPLQNIGEVQFNFKFNAIRCSVHASVGDWTPEFEINTLIREHLDVHRLFIYEPSVFCGK